MIYIKLKVLIFLNFFQVEASLTTDEANEDLLKLKGDLQVCA